jgi:hypothetical protein
VAVTYTITTSGIPDSMKLFYTTNTTLGTVGNATFTTGNTGSFTISGNTGTVTLTTATEDGNSTNDAFTLAIRKFGTTGPVLNSGGNVKIVDLTTYNTQVTNYTANGLSISWSLGQSGANGVSPSAGGTTTVTFGGTTLTAYGGTAGTSTAGGGGSWAGGDSGVAGGNGGAISTYSGGGGALGGGAGGSSATTGGAGGSMPSGVNSTGGFYQFLTNWKTVGWGSGTGGVGGGGTPSTSVNAYLYSFDGNVGAGGAGGNSSRKEGGNGGGYGGGGGGSYNASAAINARGAGGQGAIALAYLDGTTTGNVITNNAYSPGGGSYIGSTTLKSDWTTIKVWAIGGGGGAQSDNGGASAGGGAGGLTWKTYSRGASPTKPPLA